MPKGQKPASKKPKPYNMGREMLAGKGPIGRTIKKIAGYGKKKK